MDSFRGQVERFADRYDAGRRLAAQLHGVRETDPVIVGILRGGVPVASEIARAFAAPLEMIVVRKIGAPGNREYGIGAPAEEEVSVFDHTALRALDVDQTQLQPLVARARRELAQRARRYRSHAQYPVLDRTVVLVDDGLATGHTARAAARALRKRGAGRVILEDVPASVEFWWRPLVILSDGDECGGLLGCVCDGGSGDLTFDGEGELREVCVADDTPELPLGLAHPGCRPAQTHLARLPALDVAGAAAHALDH